MNDAVDAGMIIGTTDDIKGYMDRALKEIEKVQRAPTIYGRKLSPKETLMVAGSYLAAVKRLSEHVKVKCQLSVPQWSMGDSTTAYVQCTFVFEEDGDAHLVYRNIYLSVDDDGMRFNFLNRDGKYPLPTNEVPLFYPGNSHGSTRHPIGWNENDLRNTLAQIAFWNAFEKILCPAETGSEIAQCA